MKFSHKALLFIITIFMIFSFAACKPKVPIDGNHGGSEALKPSDIIQLADLINYSSKASYYEPAAVTYLDTSAEQTKLQTRIDDKSNEEGYDDFSSVVKIFANSDAAAIIEAMRLAALPNPKMTLVVDYLAGESNVEPDIEAIVKSGVWSATPGWSFFDDYEYYEQLQDRADLSTATDTDEDNVKRQYRNIAGKVFAIGMTGDEFARTFVKEMLYAVTVVEEMADAQFNANPVTPANDVFWTFCKEELDYDTLVYFLAFDDYYSEGLAKSVQLYGYYYDYEKCAYDETNDDEFEKQLKYGHMVTFTNDEWAEYVKIQRESYEDSYRYSDNFYQNSLYPVHLAFQEFKEDRDIEVYEIDKYNNLKYTEEMRNGMRDGGFAGQMRMSDWLWCYGGDSTVMNAYNEANTKYETGKSQGAENAAQGEYFYDREQLKVANYLLTNMTNTELGCALRYQIYNYSSDMISGIQNNKKDIKLLNVNKVAPEQYIYDNGYVANEDLTGAIEYAEGKLTAFITQMQNSHSKAGVENKASKATTESWSKMNQEVVTALDETNYAQIPTYIEKLDRLEDLVIKRKWSCGAEIGAETDCTHATCTKDYDTNHSISMFANNYSTILQHVSGNAVLNFKHLPEKTYTLETATPNTTYAPKYHAIATNPTSFQMLTDEMLISANDYSEYEEITIEMGLGFKEGVLNASIDTKEELASGQTEGQNWWEKKSQVPKKDVDVEEKQPGGIQIETYKHNYTFIGWYLDDKLLYKLEDTDVVNCELVLYAGYSVKKS